MNSAMTGPTGPPKKCISSAVVTSMSLDGSTGKDPWPQCRLTVYTWSRWVFYQVNNKRGKQ
jgi:hypothetical protein